MVELLLSKKGKKIGAWVWLIVGAFTVLTASLTHKDIPPGAVTVYCFVWGMITGHSMAEYFKKPEPPNAAS